MDQEKQKLKTYSAEFRESSVKLAIGSDKPITQTAKDLGVNPNTLHTWINKYSQPKALNNTVRTDEHLYEELKRLKKENARLIEERDLLKKAAAYFAKEQR
ncbi:MAG: transposase [Methylococcaceae bacterium]